MVVDDSAVVRQVVAMVLSKGVGISVSAAADPLIAMDKMRQHKPDVILLDLEMPRMDGLTFLSRLMAENPVPVVVCSSLAGKGTDIAMRALELGAVDIVTKPKLGVRNFLEDSAVLLIDAVRAASEARMLGRGNLRGKVEPKVNADAVVPPAKIAIQRTTDKVVAIGASTGGTEALRELFEALPPDSPGLIAVQHMPEAFTAAFAKRLNSTCRIEVKEAADGDRVKDGRALIAPGNRHTVLVRTGAHYMVRVVDGPLVSRHRPSVDVLFRSVAQSAGANAIGVIMTGMGDDGAQGLLEMKKAGASTLAQDEETCVVFGMPKEAISRGAVDEVLPLQRLAQGILKRSAGVMGRVVKGA
jgi:two-component system chemotaxis response regulator CheB